jgi:RND superfamily putative drug exporter
MATRAAAHMFASMLRRLSEVVVRRRWWVLGGCLLITLVAALVGRGLFDRLGYAVFYDPAAESTRGATLAKTRLGEGDPDVVALYRFPDDLTADDPGVQAAVAGLLRRVAADPSVARVVGPSGPLAERFVSADRRSTFVVLSLNGTPRTKAAELPRLRRSLDLQLPVSPARHALEVQPELGGLVPSGRALTRIARESLARGERIALPLTGLLLVIIFGSLVAALLPLAIGGLSIVLALALLDLLSHFAPVDAFAVNVVTILGLGVAIDYALFLVSRYREELARGIASGRHAGRALRQEALTRAVETAGRSVLFAGVTIAASLGGLLVFRQPFLRSVAVGGLAVTLLAATLALVVLPALIDVLGDRLERGRLPWVGRRDPQRGFWRRLAAAVIRRRVVVCVGVTLFLVGLALPFRRLQPSRADVRALPANEEPRQVADRLQRDFPAASLQPISLMVRLDGDLVEGDRLGQLYDYTERLRRVPGVVRVDSLLSFARVHDRDGAEELSPLLQRYTARAASMPGSQPGLGAVLNGRYTIVRAISSAPPDSAVAQQQIAALREIAPPPAGQVLVFGQAAALYDFAASLRARAPWMLVVVMISMFVILSLAFRSAILPIKAMLMTALSLTASFGAVVFVFQDGRLQHLLGYTALGTTDATLPVVLFAVVFGLSMDYEVLILNRIREAYLRTRDNRAAVIEGLAQTGRLVTSAAMIMVVVFSAFAVAPVVFVKALGLGMGLAVALDATVVRMLLVPSTMALLGRLNWWMPSFRLDAGPHAERQPHG